MRRQISFVLFVIITQVLLTSCATTSQLAVLERKTDQLSEKITEFDKKYQDVLNENEMLKDKLQDKVPIATSRVSGILFEVNKVMKDGEGLYIELLITNKNDYNINIGIEENEVTLVDDKGNQYKIDRIKIGKGDSFTEIYRNSSVKMTININNIKSTSKYISVLGFDDIWEGKTKQHLKTSLRNLPIN